MQKDLGNYRKSYEKNELTKEVVPNEPMQLFQQWFIELCTDIVIVFAIL